MTLKRKRARKVPSGNDSLSPIAQAEALLALATKDALALPSSSRRSRTLTDLAKQVLNLQALDQLGKRIAALEDVVSPRQPDQTDSRRSLVRRGGRRPYWSRFGVADPAHCVRRLEDLYPGLSGRERAKLVLRWLKTGEPVDPHVLSTVPPEKFKEFCRLVYLMFELNRGLWPFTCLLHEMVDKVALRLALLQVVRSLRALSEGCRIFLHYHTREPITQREHSQKLEEARQELAPIAEVAVWEAEDLEKWKPEELGKAPGQHRDPCGGEIPSGEAWERVAAEKQAMLEALIAQGILEGVQTDVGMCIRLGSYYAWKSQKAPIVPEFAEQYDIRPDEETAEIDGWRESRAALDQLLVAAALALPCPEGMKATPSSWRKAEEVLRNSIRESIRLSAAQVEAAREVIRQISEELDGEDAAVPQLRHLLEGIANRVQELYGASKQLLGDYRLPKPSEEQISAIRKSIGMSR